ncbi:MAG: omptin family outer membrane protease [Treponema sp.]|nr:omptin family outer membrane protease [Treponema sp.]
MKKHFCVILIFLFFSTLLFSFDNGLFTVSTKCYSGAYWGNIYEKVLIDGKNNSKEIYSLLDWELKPLSFYGFGFSETYYKHLTFDFDVRKGFSGKNGKALKTGCMQDYDWINGFEKGITNYSYHDCYLEDFLQMRFFAGYDFSLQKNWFGLKITPLLGWYLEKIAFSGNDGYATYKSNDWKKQVFSGQVISYSQETFVGQFGLQTQMNVFNFFGNFTLTYCPDFRINALDHHFLRDSYFNDNLENGEMWNLYMEIGYSFLSHHTFGITGEYQYVPDIYGYTMAKSNKSNWHKVSGYGGCERKIFAASIYYKLTF